MEPISSDNKITGSHRSKIGAIQTPSAETLAYAQTQNLHTLGPGPVAEAEWAEAGLPQPDLPAIRRYRIERIREQLRKYDYAGIVLYDPLNIRYATDSTNMQLWITHNASRYCFVAADGPCVLWDYHNCEFLSDHTEVVDEIRTATSWFYFGAGDRVPEMVEKWADEIVDLVTKHGAGNKRIAFDRCNPEGLDAMRARGCEVYNGEEVMEIARLVKSDDEIKAMRRAVHACEKSMDVMRAAMKPGMMEQDLWGYLHHANITRGGEWIETRLMASGPRCNPWFQECSSRIIENGDLVAFDTDLIGAYGICVDISRTWHCGDVAPTQAQKEIYTMAYEQIMRNTEWLKPGLTYRELSLNSPVVYDPKKYRHYSCLYHGVGLCDESPCIYLPHVWDAYGYDGVLEPGHVICVESYVGSIAGGPGVKLEDQVLITEDGYELLSPYRYEKELIL